MTSRSHTVHEFAALAGVTVKALLDAECGGDRETLSALVTAWRSRAVWPPAMRRYYAMDADTWRRAADFLDAACERAPA